MRVVLLVVFLLTYKKAFDIAEHDILLPKLEHYGIHVLANEWFKSYLSNRKQYASINGYDLNLTAVTFSFLKGQFLVN